MEISEEKIYEALGIPEPEPEAEPEPEPELQADTQAEDSEQDDDELDGDLDEAEDSETEVSEVSEEAQSEEDRAAQAKRERNAERRRRRAERDRAERENAIRRAAEDATERERARGAAEMESFFRTAGLMNTLTDKPITTIDEWTEYQRAFEAERLERELQAGRLSAESLDTAIANSPAMRAAQEVLQREETVKRQEQEQAVRARADAELLEIQKLDPSVTAYEDVLAMPTGAVFYEHVSRGLGFLDAFKLANMDALMSRLPAGVPDGDRTAPQPRGDAARQAAMQQARSKDHLNRSAPRGEGAASVPSEEMELYKLLMPNMTEAEIAADYKKRRN